MAPGHIRKLRTRRNKKDKDNEDDGADALRPSNSHVLSLILRVIIIFMLFPIMLLLIVWLMS